MGNTQAWILSISIAVIAAVKLAVWLNVRKGGGNG
jgi:hypothetical protein